jgi:hypothetical protein
MFLDIQTSKIWGWAINKVFFVSILHYYKKWVSRFDYISKITFLKVLDYLDQ